MNKNLKWIVRYVVLAAIISYGLGLTLERRDGTFELLSEKQQDQVKDFFYAFPEGIRAMVKYGHKKEYWEDMVFVTQLSEKENPTLIGSVIISIVGEQDEESGRSMEWTSVGE